MQLQDQRDTLMGCCYQYHDGRC